jgi:hypothetical protein
MSNEYDKFDELAQQIIQTPKPTAESAGEPVGEPADEDAEREDS